MAGSRFKAENGILATGSSTNSIFEHVVSVTGNVYVTGDLLYVGANLYVSGNLVYTNTQISGDLVPTTPVGQNLGNNTSRFDGYFRNINVSGNLHPSANGLLLGNTGRRWDTYSTNIDAVGTLTLGSTANVAGALNVNGAVTIANVVAEGNTTITGFVNVTSSANVGGNLRVNGTSTLVGNTSITGNVVAKGIILDNAAIYSNSASVTTTAATIIDSYPKSQSFFGKVIVTVNAANSSLHSIEMNYLHDNTNVLVTKYGEVYNTNLGTFDIIINNANVEISFTATSANTYTVKTLRQIVLS